MAWMDILKCSDGSYYAGSTINLEKRFTQHQAGKGAKYTARRLPVYLVFAEEFARVEKAYAREKQVQAWSRAKRETLIRGDFYAVSRLGRKVLERDNPSGSDDGESPAVG